MHEEPVTHVTHKQCSENRRERNATNRWFVGIFATILLLVLGGIFTMQLKISEVTHNTAGKVDVIEKAVGKKPAAPRIEFSLPEDPIARKPSTLYVQE